MTTLELDTIRRRKNADALAKQIREKRLHEATFNYTANNLIKKNLLKHIEANDREIARLKKELGEV